MIGVSAQTWQDIVAMIGVQRESSSLDFKAEITGKPGEIAKDIAAMTLEGGILIYGVAEDKKTGLAASIPTVPLAGAEERIRQIVAGIAPLPAIEIRELRKVETDEDGVLVVVVPKSEKAPHMTNGRFVVRNGTTTRELTEHEIALAYESRMRRNGPPDAVALLSDVDLLPGLDDIGPQTAFDGFGRVRMSARPERDALTHPDGAQLRRALDDAIVRARAQTDSALAVYRPTTLLEDLDDWRPLGTEGWGAGWAGGDEAKLSARPAAAAVVAYPARVTAQVSIPTAVLNNVGGPEYQCAYEGKVAAELYAALSFAAEFFARVAPVDLEVAAELSGFSGAVSYYASHARAGLDSVAYMKPAADGDLRALRVSHDELVRAPKKVAQQLLDRWLVTFYDGPPLLDYIAPDLQNSTRLV